MWTPWPPNKKKQQQPQSWYQNEREKSREEECQVRMRAIGQRWSGEPEQPRPEWQRSTGGPLPWLLVDKKPPSHHLSPGSVPYSFVPTDERSLLRLPAHAHQRSCPALHSAFVRLRLVRSSLARSHSWLRSQPASRASSAPACLARVLLRLRLPRRLLHSSPPLHRRALVPARALHDGGGRRR